MARLTFVGPSHDGSRLVFSNEDGETFDIELDERLISVVTRQQAVRPQAVIRSGPGPMPAVKELQHRIRHGESVHRIAADLGISVDQLSALAGPALREREHIWALAQSTYVADDRTTLGDGVIAQARRLIGSAEPDVTWEAWREPSGDWTVVADFGHRATFTFVPRTKTLTARDELAHLVLGTTPQPTASRPTNEQAKDSRPAPTSRTAPAAERPSVAPDDTSDASPDEDDHRHWDRSHPAARAAARRAAASVDSPTESETPTGSTIDLREDSGDESVEHNNPPVEFRRRHNNDEPASVDQSAQQPALAFVASPSDEDSTPAWEELLFGTPRDTDD